MKNLLALFLTSISVVVLVSWNSEKLANKNNFLFANHPGANTQFEYLDPLKRHCIAKANSTPSPKSFGGVNDPEWLVSYNNGKTWDGPYEAISIIDDNNTVWRTSMHATFNHGNGYLMWLENLHGSDKHWSRGAIDILDWSGKKWQISNISAVSNVQFTLTPKK